MFVERDENGNIVSAFAVRQSFPVEEVEDNNEELLDFLNRGLPTQGE